MSAKTKQTNKRHPVKLQQLFKLKFLLTVIFLLVAGGIVSWAIPSLIKSAQDEPLEYKAFVTGNLEKNELFPETGLIIGLDIRELKRIPLKELEKLAEENKPTRATLYIDSQEIPLTVDAASSGAGLRAIWWNFKVIRLSTTDMKNLAGKTVTVTWMVRGKTFTQQVNVEVV